MHCVHRPMRLGSLGAGLWLQGCIGRLARLHGLACDAIVGAVVISDDISSSSLSSRLVSIAALLRRYSPCAKVAQSRSYSPFRWPIIIYILFGYAVRKMLTLHYYIPGDEVSSLGPKWDASRNNLFWAQGRFFSKYRFWKHECVSKSSSP
jgi:hypothetical protein